jgi:hypothetical protein
MSMKNSNDTIGNRSRDLPVCSAVPQPLRHRVDSVLLGVRIYVALIAFLFNQSQNLIDRTCTEWKKNVAFIRFLYAVKVIHVEVIVCVTK